MQMITTTEALAHLCEKFAHTEYITLDTEFIREKTYYPQLCLIQIAGPEDACAVDPLAEGMDLSPLFALLANKNVLKVFHAARQDLEIFYALTGKLPTPLVDTQIAAMVCGYGESVGYEPLVAKLLGEVVDKSSRFTDWARRPLTEKQIHYAIADVTHLRGVFEKLRAQIEAAGRMHWIEEEVKDLSNYKRYEVNPDEVWQRLRHRSRSPKFLAILREIAKWRELEAQSQDVPRGRIMKDDTLLEIAAQAPGTIEELKNSRGLGNNLNVKKLKSLFEAIDRARSIPLEECPRLEHKKSMPAGLESVCELLRVLLKIKCDEAGVAHKLVASKEDLENFVQGKQEVSFLNGWRHELFGQFAKRLISGTVSIGFDNNNRSIIMREHSV